MFPKGRRPVRPVRNRPTAWESDLRKVENFFWIFIIHFLRCSMVQYAWDFCSSRDLASWHLSRHGFVKPLVSACSNNSSRWACTKTHPPEDFVCNGPKTVSFFFCNTTHEDINWMIPQMLRNYTHKKTRISDFLCGVICWSAAGCGTCCKAAEVQQWGRAGKTARWSNGLSVIIMGKSEKWRFWWKQPLIINHNSTNQLVMNL